MTTSFGHHLMPGHRKKEETNFRNAETQTGPWKSADMDQDLAEQSDLAQDKNMSSETVTMRY